MKKQTYIDTARDCDLCDQTAKWDTPIYPQGPWGYVCDADYRNEYGEKGHFLAIELIVGEEPEVDEKELRKQILDAIYEGDLDLAEELIGDGDVSEWI